MPFDFHAAYLLSGDGFKPEVVLGVHENATRVTDEDERDVIWFLLTHGRQRIRYLDGEVADSGDGTSSVKTKVGVFQFEPLTLERWQEAGEGGWIIGFDRLKGKFGSDHEIQQFYLHEFLDPSYLKWVGLQGFDPNS